MMTVHEVSELTGVSIRTLQYYDQIGLLQPAQRTEAGYRLYDDTALERLQQILLFRELAFSLDEIKAILDAPDFDREKALDQQIELLTLKRERLDAIIALARFRAIERSLTALASKSRFYVQRRRSSKRSIIQGRRSASRKAILDVKPRHLRTSISINRQRHRRRISINSDTRLMSHNHLRRPHRTQMRIQATAQRQSCHRQHTKKY